MVNPAFEAEGGGGNAQNILRINAYGTANKKQQRQTSYRQPDS